MDEEKWVEQVRRTLDSKSTEELLQIWQKNDHNEWTDAAFTAIAQILEARRVDPGPQSQPGAQAGTAQTNQRQRPGCVTAFAILIVIGAASSVLGLFTGILGAIGRNYIDTGSKFEIAITLAFAILYVGIAVGLWQLKNWARIAVIILLSLNILLMIAFVFSGLFFFVIGLALAGYALYWFATNAKYFEPAAASELPQPTN